jgi:hypothetical protein
VEKTTQRIAVGAAVLITLAALHLHLVWLTHAGGLWRDEVAITNMATLPSLALMWQSLPHDHCPALLPLLIRGWAAVTGGSDIALRCLGLLLGLLLLGSLWLAAKLIWRGLPLLSLGLLAMNAMAVRYGDAVRAYGMATACIVLTMALIWRFIEKPAWRRAAVASLMATLSVQALYQNAFFVLALCLAGFAVFGRRRQWRNGMKVLAIGVVPALSLLPYAQPLLAAQDWWIVSKTGVIPELVWINLRALTGFPWRAYAYLWMAIGVVAAITGIHHALKGRTDDTARPGKSPDPQFFAAIALLLGVGGFETFLAKAGLPTQPWYFLLLAGFLIVCCDAIFASQQPPVRSTVLAIAVMAGLAAYPAGLQQLQVRQTDGDLLAARVAQQAAPEDLVVVNPWYCALTFQRYYHGRAPWTTLAGLDDYRYHRYDLLKVKLQMAHPAQPALERVAATLAAGHRVWIVGDIPRVAIQNGPPPDLPPAPGGPFGWFDEPYSYTWSAQLSYLVATHAKNAMVIGDARNPHVNPLENLRLIVVSGWRTEAMDHGFGN